MKIKLLLSVAVMGIFMLFTSCQKFPEAEISTSTAAVDSVKAVGGESFVPDVFKALVDSLESAKLEAENAKSKLFSNYKKSVEKLTFVNQMAADALTKVEARKVELRAENEALVAEVKTLILTNNELIKKLPYGKDGKIALESIKADISVIETTVLEVEALIASDDILGANTKIKAASEKAVSIKVELEEVLAKIGK
jgi:hypothetical protein